MHKTLSNILACSYCNNQLEIYGQKLKCMKCGLIYSYNASGSLDLRLKKQKCTLLKFKLGDELRYDTKLNVEPLKINPNPEVFFNNITVPHHLSKEILSYFPKAKKKDSLMLDLGCGAAIHKSVCEYAGFQWVGMDYNSAKAPILGDGHALPFMPESFEFVLSIAVLEHIRYPFVMLKEVFRTLKSNGLFIGTVAFLEPFHGASFYHHTHLGLINCLSFSGFEIIKIAPNVDWSVLKAQSSMALFPKMPGWIAKSIVQPIQLLHRIWWWIGSLTSAKSTEQSRVRNTTGAFTFVAMKGLSKCQAES